MKKILRKTIRFFYFRKQKIIATILGLVLIAHSFLFACIFKELNTEEIIETTTEPQWEWFEASAYCSCRICCGKYADDRPTDEYGEEIVYGKAGIPLEEGRSIAADWSILPQGTVVEIEGYGVYTVEDIGGEITGYKIDIYFESHEIANAFGRKTVAIRVLKEGGGPSENKG